MTSLYHINISLQEINLDFFLLIMFTFTIEISDNSEFIL